MEKSEETLKRIAELEKNLVTAKEGLTYDFVKNDKKAKQLTKDKIKKFEA
jgi:hypothetical protein